MPWEINRDDKRVAHSIMEQFKDDKIIAYSSVGGGPAFFEWHTKVLSADINLTLFSRYAYEIKITSSARGCQYKGTYVVDSVRWEDNGFVYIFKPMARAIAEKHGTFYYPSVQKLSDLEKVVNGEIMAENFVYPANLDENRFFNGLAYEGPFIQFLSDFCFRLGMEYSITDDTVVIGMAEFEDKDPYEIRTAVNTQAVTNLYGLDVLIVESYYQPVPIGSPIVFGKLNGRLFMWKYEWSADSERTTFYIASPEMHVDDMHLKLLLPDGMRKFSYIPRISEVVFSSFDGDGNRYMVGGDDIVDSTIPRKELESNRVNIVSGLPYAGDGVGVQFPERSGNSLVVYPKGVMSSAVSVADVYTDEDNVPIKEKNDFRLTLPGATIYIDDSGNIYVSGKGKVYIGGSGTPEYNKAKGSLMSGTLPDARKDDPTISDISTDNSYWTWMNKFMSALSLWMPVAGDGGAALKAALASVISSWPTKQEGKIKEGSSNVEVN